MSPSLIFRARPLFWETWLGLALFVACVSVPATALAADVPPRSYYVVTVGIDQYANIRALSGAVNDANAVAAMFAATGARISKATHLRNEKAGTSAIWSAITAIDREAAPDDVVVLFLAGHGSRRAGAWYFCPYDYQPGMSGLFDNELLRQLKTLVSHGHIVLLVIDSCFAGQIQHSVVMRELTYFAPRVDANNRVVENMFDWPDDKLRPGGGLILLASCVPSEPSNEYGGNGAFTRAFLRAFQGGADTDQNGRVTLKELRTFLPLETTAILSQKPKLPGRSRTEQTCLCVSTLAIPETFVVARSVAAQQPPQGNAIRGPHRSRLSEKPVGVWRAAWRVMDAAGKPVLDKGRPVMTTYTLRINADDSYEAIYTDEYSRETTWGTIGFALPRSKPSADRVVPGTGGAVTDGEFQDKIADFFGYGPEGLFALEYENGIDYLDARLLTGNGPDVLELSVLSGRQWEYVLGRPTRFARLSDKEVP